MSVQASCHLGRPNVAILYNTATRGARSTFSWKRPEMAQVFRPLGPKWTPIRSVGNYTDGIYNSVHSECLHPLIAQGISSEQSNGRPPADWTSPCVTFQSHAGNHRSFFSSLLSVHLYRHHCHCLSPPSTDGRQRYRCRDLQTQARSTYTCQLPPKCRKLAALTL